MNTIINCEKQCFHKDKLYFGLSKHLCSQTIWTTLNWMMLRQIKSRATQVQGSRFNLIIKSRLRIKYEHWKAIDKQHEKLTTCKQICMWSIRENVNSYLPVKLKHIQRRHIHSLAWDINAIPDITTCHLHRWWHPFCKPAYSILNRNMNFQFSTL